MPIEERIESVADIRQWTDTIPFQYEYTAGVAGERFLRGLMDGKILAGYCPGCNESSLPARIYCVRCYGGITEYVEVEPVGKVRAVTSAKQDAFAFVTFKDVRGGLVHRLLDRARAGTEVVPRFRPRSERTGSILDLQGFESRR
ncbi:MAG: zinc ribbon domain-containing protein [Thaumarchaeota archaeon]|nr:zinc ribbon domain-containing protein [Nitrososphaerota archaeon]